MSHHREPNTALRMLSPLVKHGEEWKHGRTSSLGLIGIMSFKGLIMNVVILNNSVSKV